MNKYRIFDHQGGETAITKSFRFGSKTIIQLVHHLSTKNHHCSSRAMLVDGLWQRPPASLSQAIPTGAELLPLPKMYSVYTSEGRVSWVVFPDNPANPPDPPKPHYEYTLRDHPEGSGQVSVTANRIDMNIYNDRTTSAPTLFPEAGPEADLFK